MVASPLPLEGKASTVILSASHTSDPGASRIQAQVDGWPAPPSQYSKAQVVSDNLQKPKEWGTPVPKSGRQLPLQVEGLEP